jgi:putative membrane protein
MESLMHILPAVNAVLISTSGIFILMGVSAIRRGQRTTHQQRMLIATGLASLFFILYVLRMALGGMTLFQGPHWVKLLYLAILASHVGLAMVQAPMTLVTLYRAFRGQFPSHRKIARITYPIWVYVSFTGVLVYGLLHFPYA